jgi:hypothetical protein
MTPTVGKHESNFGAGATVANIWGSVNKFPPFTKDILKRPALDGGKMTLTVHTSGFV